MPPTRSVRQLNHYPIEDGPLEETVLPTTLELVAMQMDMLANNQADQAVAHMEADRLLLHALHIITNGTDIATVDSIDHVHAITNSFYTIKKYYE